MHRFLYRTLTISGLLFSLNTQAQTYEELLAEGKKSVIEQHSLPDNSHTPDYTKAITTLRKAAAMRPNDPEVHYFLGSALDYNNNPDGSFMYKTTKEGTLAASNEFETVKQLTPKYTGEKILLDPYTKLGSIWGSLALAYMVHNEYDSARWAFAQGKQRGGFPDFTLGFYRFVLNTCPKDAIFFSEGDIGTMASWYLQEVEKIRPDVTILDINMIQIPWYNAFIYQKHASIFSSPVKALDTTLFGPCPDEPIIVTDKRTGKKLKWRVPPRSGDYNYIYRCDLTLLDIVTYNKFERPICFSGGSRVENQIGLTPFLKNNLFIDVLSTDSTRTNDPTLSLKLNNFPFDLISKVNTNCDEEMNIVTNIQYKYIYTAFNLMKQKKKGEARNLFHLVAQNIPFDKFPIPDTATADYVQQLAEMFKDK